MCTHMASEGLLGANATMVAYDKRMQIAIQRLLAEMPEGVRDAIAEKVEAAEPSAQRQ